MVIHIIISLEMIFNLHSTPRKFALVCQSYTAGIIPANFFDEEFIFTLTFMASLILAAVSWSTPNKIECKVVLSFAKLSPMLQNCLSWWTTDRTYSWWCHNMSTISSSLFSFFNTTPRGTYIIIITKTIATTRRLICDEKYKIINNDNDT